jgi:hypothetical protein
MKTFAKILDAIRSLWQKIPDVLRNELKIAVGVFVSIFVGVVTLQWTQFVQTHGVPVGTDAAISAWFTVLAAAIRPALISALEVAGANLAGWIEQKLAPPNAASTDQNTGDQP